MFHYYHVLKKRIYKHLYDEIKEQRETLETSGEMTFRFQPAKWPVETKSRRTAFIEYARQVNPDMLVYPVARTDAVMLISTKSAKVTRVLNIKTLEKKRGKPFQATRRDASFVDADLVLPKLLMSSHSLILSRASWIEAAPSSELLLFHSRGADPYIKRTEINLIHLMELPVCSLDNQIQKVSGTFSTDDFNRLQEQMNVHTSTIKGCINIYNDVIEAYTSQEQQFNLIKQAMEEISGVLETDTDQSDLAAQQEIPF